MSDWMQSLFESDLHRGIGGRYLETFGINGRVTVTPEGAGTTPENDLLGGSTGNDTIVGAQGNDAIDGRDGNDYVNGNVGQDHLEGGWGNDLVVGGSESVADDDVLYGNGDGGTPPEGAFGDNDTLIGGAGNDIFVYALGEGSDVVQGGADIDLLVITNMSPAMFDAMVELPPGFDDAGLRRHWDSQTAMMGFLDAEGNPVPMSGSIRFGEQRLSFSDVEFFVLGG